MTVDATRPNEHAVEAARGKTERRGLRGEGLDAYILLERLGADSWSETLTCHDPAGPPERLSVVRRMRPAVAREPDLRERFLEAARRCAGLSHPCLPATLEIGEREEPYVVLEYADGVRFGKLLADGWRRGARGIRLAALALSQVAAGLAHGHQACDERGAHLRLVHGEVSPKNIVVSPLGRVRLVGWGRPLGAAGRQPVWYAAPEVVRGEPVDGRADVYSLGVCLYLAATGQLPHPSRDEAAVRRDVEAGTYTLPAHANPFIDQELNRLLLWAMDPYPERRPDARELSRTLIVYATRGLDGIGPSALGAWAEASSSAAWTTADQSPDGPL